jgi:hypothetical protein
MRVFISLITLTATRALNTSTPEAGDAPNRMPEDQPCLATKCPQIQYLQRIRSWIERPTVC